MANDIKDLESGDLAWFSLSEDDMPQIAEVESIVDNFITFKLDRGVLIGDVTKFHLIEKWWGHGPLGDGTGMGPDGFDPDWASKEEKSNDIKDLEQ